MTVEVLMGGPNELTSDRLKLIFHKLLHQANET